jgi:hypothetical protein
MRRTQFQARQPRARFSDLIRLLILGGLGGFVFVNRAELERLGPTGPMSPEQPWIVTPALLANVSAGLVKFEGTGPTGCRVEVVENGRLVGESWIKDGKWALTGKLFGPGPTSVRARIAGVKGKRSPARHLTVKGHVEPTVAITAPVDGDYIQAGKLNLEGAGKPGDELLIFYNNVVVAKAVANKDHKWSKTIVLSEPKKEGYFKVVSKSESESVLLFVRGTG